MQKNSYTYFYFPFFIHLVLRGDDKLNKVSLGRTILDKNISNTTSTEYDLPNREAYYSWC